MAGIAYIPDEDTLRQMQMQAQARPDAQPAPQQTPAVPVIGANSHPNATPHQSPQSGPAIPPIDPGAVSGLWSKADNIKNPVLRIIGKVGAGSARALQTIGDTFAPGLTQNIPGTDLNAERNRERTIQTQELQQKENQNAATTSRTNVETAELPADAQSKRAAQSADTAHTQAETDRLRQPIQESLQQSYADAVQKAVKAGNNPLTDPDVQRYSDALSSVQKEPASHEPKTIEMGNKTYQYDDKADAWKPIGAAKEQGAATNLIVTPEGQVQQARPGMTLAPGTQNISGFAGLNRPTVQERNVGAQAELAAQGIPGVIGEIDRLKDKLGPVSGRWNEFMQGKVGADNPEFAGLRADLLMVSSAIALAHARGRLPENLREEFDHAINAPQQDPENLKAVLNHIQPWLQKASKMGQVGQQSNEVAPPAAAGGGFAQWKSSQGK